MTKRKKQKLLTSSNWKQRCLFLVCLANSSPKISQKNIDTKDAQINFNLSYDQITNFELERSEIMSEVLLCEWKKTKN